MKVFLTGGTGAVGWPAVDALVAGGHDVTALARTPAKADQLASRGAKPVTLSLFDEEALASAFAGQDAVANLATALPATHQFTSMRAWRENHRIRTEGSRSVAQAASRAQVSTLVQESVAMIYPDGGDRWITESTAPDRFPMAEGNLAAEDSAFQFTTRGGTGVVLRFGWFYGPGAAHAEEFLALAKRHVCVQMGGPRTYVSSIHVDDAGRAVAAALELPAGAYNVIDDEPVTKSVYADALSHAVEARCWVRLPGRAASLLGHRTTSLTRSLRVSNAKLCDAAQWRPVFPSVREGWADTARRVEESR